MSSSPFGTVDDDDDDDDAWLDDVAPASTSDVDRSFSRGGAEEDFDGEDDWMRGAHSSSSASVSPMSARAPAAHASAMYAQAPSSGARPAGGLFGDSTPSASASPTGRAVVFERTTSAFEPSPPGGVYGAPSPPPIASASSSYVEYAEKDLGALFGGADDGDDWISSSASAAPVEKQASAFPATPDVVRVVEQSPVPVASVQYAASAPFASPMMKDDGTDFFNDLGASADDVTEPGAVASMPFGSPMDAGLTHVPSPVTLASATPPPSSPPTPTFATDATEYESAPFAEELPAVSHVLEDAAAPVSALSPPPPPQEAFYEEQYAPAEFSHAEFTSAYEATFDQTANVQETSEPAHAQDNDVSYSNEQQYHEYDASHVVQPPEIEPPLHGHYYHEQQEHAGPDVNETSSIAHVAVPPPPQVGYDEPVVEASAPPIISAYSGSTENFPRVSSSNSVTEMYSPATTPPPMRPTFMVPSPVQPSPAAAYAPAVRHYEQQPAMMQNTGYAAYEPHAPAPSTYAAPPTPNVSTYASYQTGETQNLEYAAYGETPSSRAVKYDDSNRSPDGRPAHVAMSFGFGGSLILSGPGYAGGRTSHGTSIPPCSLRVHSVRALLADGNALGVSYVRSLEQIRGPLAGQRADNVIKMIDALLNSNGDARRDSEVLLWRVLSAMLRHKGVLTLEGDILGENRKSALAEISAIIAGDAAGTSGDGWAAASAGVSPLNPAESSDARAIVQVENLLISGQRGAALNLAIQAKLWPHAILLAGHLGGKHYQETIAQMSMSVCRAGSPLHTLEVLMAGFPQELISNRDGTQMAGHSRVRELLPRWREHVAILCSNPTNGSEIVLKALGDELWMAQNDISAAHVAYALSREKPSAYSYNSRMCLVNADHRKQPRTYATPTAIKLTELLESALVGSNSQAQIASLLPYKLLYAGALAEIGHLREALSYVENVLKCLRSLDKMNPEVDVVRVGTLAAQMEHRLQDGLRGKGGNLAGAAVDAAKTLVSGFKGLLDRSVSTLFGDESDAQAPHGGAHVQHQPQPMHPAPYVAQATPHASYQAHQSSPVSAPQPQQHQQPVPPSMQQQPQSQSPQGMHKSSSGSGLLRSVSSLFSGGGGTSTPAAETPRPPPADENVFYYNETLKMWCERGKEPTQEAPPPGAPPVRSESPTSSMGVSPPGPPPVMAVTHNASQLRQSGIHSRYVDTFNTTPRTQQSPANVAPAQGFVPMAPSAGTAPKAPGQFFMPAPVVQHSRDASTESYSSQSQSHEFYGYSNTQHAAEHSPAPAISSAQGGALPTPPDIDPSSLLAPPSMTHPGSLPNTHHAYGNQPAEIVAEELTELKLN